MSIYKGTLLKLNTVDRCNRKFSKDCKITYPKKVPVLYNFEKKNLLDGVIGRAEIVKSEDGLDCLMELKDDFDKDEYYVGGMYSNIQKSMKSSIEVITEGNLICASIVTNPSEPSQIIKKEV